MKKLYIVANWKSNKTESEAMEWLRQFSIFNFQFSISEKEIVICPPFTLLSELKSYILNHKSSVALSAQNVSSFEEGAYTGEINAGQIKELADYVIIGHSERRRYFSEDKTIINKKIENAIGHDLIPILCISNMRELNDSLSFILGQKIIIAYEPLEAIGSGKADTKQDVSLKAAEIKKIAGDVPVLYGGSVTEENVFSFTSLTLIDGVLVGGASLDPLSFANIIKFS